MNDSESEVNLDVLCYYILDNPNPFKFVGYEGSQTQCFSHVLLLLIDGGVSTYRNHVSCTHLASSLYYCYNTLPINFPFTFCKQEPWMRSTM